MNKDPVLYFVAAVWMYLYPHIPIPTCQSASSNQPTIVYRSGCYMTSSDASPTPWIKLIVIRPGIRSLAVTFESRNVSCDLTDGTSVLVRYHDGNHISCVALWDNQVTEKPTCAYRCSCVGSCTYVSIGTVGNVQQEICNVSYYVTWKEVIFSDSGNYIIH